MLGLGAGIDGRTAATVYPHHIQAASDGVTLTNLPGLPDIAITGMLDHWLQTWSAATKAGQPLVTRHQINGQLGKLQGGKTPLVLARLRTTYIVALIEAGVPLRELLLLAGLQSPSALSEYIVHADGIPLRQAVLAFEAAGPLSCVTIEG